MGRLSDPLEIAEALAAQGSQRIDGPREVLEIARSEGRDDPYGGPREESGTAFKPFPTTPLPSDADDLIAAYQAGATLNQLADHYGIHRTTVAAHLDRHGAPRHDDRTAWDEGALEEAAEMYAAGLSLVDVASRFGIDAQTVANRFRRAGRPIRPRRGWRLQP